MAKALEVISGKLFCLIPVLFFSSYYSACYRLKPYFRSLIMVTMVMPATIVV